MSLRTYNANWLLWFALSLALFLLYFYGIEYGFALFSGRLRMDALLSFEFVGPAAFSVVMGWLAQCAIAISFRKIRGNPKPK